MIVIGTEVLGRFSYAFQDVFDRHLSLFDYLAARGRGVESASAGARSDRQVRAPPAETCKRMQNSADRNSEREVPPPRLEGPALLARRQQKKYQDARIIGVFQAALVRHARLQITRGIARRADRRKTVTLGRLRLNTYPIDLGHA